MQQHHRLLAGLIATLTRQGDPPDLRETHISSVLLGRERAWKIKKPVNFGFLDFSTLEQRRHFCHEELRLNRRFAPDLYLAVTPISGTLENPQLGGTGPPLDYAVTMRRFADQALLANCPQALSPNCLDRLCDQLVRHHQQAPSSDPFGSPEAVWQPLAENLRVLQTYFPNHPALQPLRRQARTLHQRLTPHFAQRRQEQHIRECHGDLHLGNIALLNGEPTPFDAIEFNPKLRWIDTANDLAFLLMDLTARNLHSASSRLLNRYLEQSSDYSALTVLRYYQLYRATVRAKICALSGDRDDHQASAELAHYLALATRYATPLPRYLAITCGPSGAGKSTTAQQLASRDGAVQLRADAIRKRLAGLPPEASSAALPYSIYTPEFSANTYRELLALAEVVSNAGVPVIVDATFLRAAHRAPFQQLAQRLGVPYAILHFQTPERLMVERIGQRLAVGNDASEADQEVLARQLPQLEPLTRQERRFRITIRPGEAVGPLASSKRRGRRKRSRNPMGESSGKHDGKE